MARYLNDVRRALPLYEEHLETMMHILQRAAPDLRLFVDLGCGDGILGSCLLARYPACRGVFVDFSDAMLSEAGRKLEPFRERVTLIRADYSNDAWTGALPVLQGYDAIVSGFSIHHQPDEKKRTIYRQCHELLASGGIFLNMEHVAPSSSWAESIYENEIIEALWRQGLERNEGRSKDQVATAFLAREDKAENILADVDDQCEWLRQIGFVDVDCYFKIYELALFGGRKASSDGA